MATAPTGDEPLTPDDAVNVLEEILEAENKSFVLGLKLKLPLHVVDGIHSTNLLPRDHLLQILIEFTKQVDPRPTWKAIVDAIKSPAVNLPQLAMRLEAAHFPDPTATRDPRFPTATDDIPPETTTFTVTRSEATFDISPVTSPETSFTETSGDGTSLLVKTTTDGNTEITQPAPTSIRLLTTKPTLPELLNLKTSSGNTVNIIQQIGTHYHVLGPLLLRDDTGAVTSAIVSQHLRDAALVNQEILTRWLQGQGKLPVSWFTLINVLKNAGLSEIAQMILESLTGSTTQISVTRAEATSDMPTMTSPETSSSQISAAGASPLAQSISSSGSDIVQPTLHKSHVVTDHKPHITNEVAPQQSPMTLQYIQAKIRQFEKRFNALKKSSRECLERLGVPVKRVADALTSLPADDMDEHKVFLKENLSALYQAPDHSELFGTMNFHWNYQNYQLLDHVVREFDLEGVKGEMKTYKKDLQQFRKKTPLKLFCQSHKKKHVNPPPEFHEAVVEFNWPDHVTLEVVEEFRQEYADHYSLRECAMMLNKVLPGSFIVTWFIPGSIVKKLKGKVPSSILKKYSVTKLEIAGECIYPEPTKEESTTTLRYSDGSSTPPAGATTTTSRAISHQSSEEGGVASTEQEYQFVKEPSKDFFCPVTFSLLLQPHLTTCCGKHLSHEAATRIQGEGGACPLCKEPHLSTVLNKHFLRQVNELHVFCRHMDRGCRWHGELSDMERHVQSKSCPMKTPPVYNDRGMTSSKWGVPIPEVSLKLLVNDLASVRRTFDLGIQLGVPESDLNDIEVEYRYSVADRRRETVNEWLNIDEQPSWSKLVRALVAISERHVARNIALKYGIHFPSELEPESAQEKSATASPVFESGLDKEEKTKPRRIKSSTKKEDSKLAEIDKELDRQKTERRQERERSVSVTEQAVVVMEDVEKLEQEKQDLLKEIKEKERQLGYFKKLHGQQLLENYCEKNDLQESIQTKEKELQDAKAKLKENEKKLKKYKEKVCSLKKQIEEGVRELGIRDESIIQLEKKKAEVVANLESERLKSTESKLRKEELTEKEDQLKKELEENDAHIHSNSNQISDLQQQVQKLTAEMNAQSLVQYKQLTKLQEDRMEREREKAALESELMVFTQRREEEVKIIRKQLASNTCNVSGPGLQSATANHPTHVIVELTDSSNRPCSVPQRVTAQLEPISKATPTSGGRWPWSKKEQNTKPPAVHAVVAPTSPFRYEVLYTPISRGQHELHVRLNDIEINGSPFTMTVYPDPTQLAHPVRVVTGLDGPYGIAFNSREEMIVSEWGGHRIAIFDIRGRRIQTFGSRGYRPEQMIFPKGIAVDDVDNIYVSSEDKLQKFTSSGDLVKCVGQRGSKEGEFNVPRGVALHNNKVYVCDHDNHRIQVFDLDLNFIQSVGSHGNGRGEFNAPHDVKFDPDGFMYIVEYGNERVQVLDRRGRFIRVFGMGKLHGPSALDILDKYVYVSDNSGHCIVVYETSGQFATSLDGWDHDFKYPYCISSCTDGFIHVCDFANKRVQIF